MTDLAAAPRPLFLPSVWLLSRWADLAFLFGGALVSLALFGSWQAGWLTPTQIVLLWIFVFHGPHFWATMSRTYCDRTEWATRKRLFLGSLAWFGVGPVLVGGGLLVENATGRPEVWQAFFFLAALWAYHHVIKQHFGFVALYRARAGEFDRRELMFHRWYLVIGLWMPALVVLFSARGWVEQNPIVTAWVDAFGVQSAVNLVETIQTIGPIGFWTTQGILGLYLVWRAINGRGINVQATAICVVASALHWVAVNSALTAETALGAYAFVPLVTIYHNIQYHALIWHYNREKYHVPDARERFGLAATVNTNLFVYVVLGVAYTLATIGIEHYGIGFLQKKPDGEAGRNIALVFTSAIWGWSFLHYYVDGKIWKVGQDRDLQRVLGFSPPPSADAARPASSERPANA